MAKDRQLVYSSDKTAAPHVSSGPCKIRLESKGRGGKQVTVIFQLPFPEAKAREHLKALQSKLGTGGTYKDHTLEIRGDVRTQVETYFSALGIKTVRAGG